MSGQDFDRTAVERILQRAVRLAEADAGEQFGGISEQALVEAAEELGIDTTLVTRALTEERLGLLAAERRRTDALVGPSTVVATRILDGSPTQVLEAADAWLRRTGVLRRQRRDAHTAEYRRRGDVLAGVQRTARSVLGEEQLGVSRLRASAQPLEEGRSLLGLTADLQDRRTVALLGGGGVAVVGSVASALGALSTIWWWLGVPASVGAGVGAMAVRRRGVDEVRMQLEGALDRIALDGPEPSTLASVGRRLRSVRSRSVRPADR